MEEGTNKQICENCKEYEAIGSFDGWTMCSGCFSDWYDECVIPYLEKDMA